MKRLILHLLALASVFGGSVFGAERPPNIVYLLIDDLGYADCGFMGSKDTRTPHIDKLAQGGAVLESFYVQPLCSPTRAALLTGRYATHTGVYTVVRPGAPWGLPLAERTLPQALREAGYATAICGKWHLGEFQPDYTPTRRGFDHQYGHMFGAIDYFTHKRDGKHDWYRDDKPSVEEGYSTHLVAREACRIIRDQPADKPLFLYVPFNGIHGPHQVPASYKGPYAGLMEPRQTIAGMLAAVDEAVGQITAALDEKQVRQNTLLIFSSDNGGPNPGRATMNTPLRAGKGTIYEGGVRACAIVNWPGMISPNTTNKEPIHAVDWYPTLLKLAGAPSAQKLAPDGLDIWPVLTQGAKSPHDAILLQGTTPARAAVRMGDWKLLLNASEKNGEEALDDEAGSAGTVELYNLAEDIGESRNLAASQPAKVQALRTRLRAFLKEAAPPGNLRPATKLPPIHLGGPARSAEAPRPNILILLADDVGFSDIGCFGGEISTPHLDALARDGVRFTQFYNTARCCPTRASLLTGLHPHQAGLGHMMDDRGHNGYRGGLNRQCVTIAEALQPAGYRSYAVGKWHVTPGQTAKRLADTHNWPLQRGFDRFYGTIHGAGSYFDPSSLVRDNELITVANDPEYQPKEFYYTDAIGEHAVKFIREHARDHPEQPFFLYTAFTAAHWPLHAKDSDMAKYKGRYDGGYEPVRAARRLKMKQLGLLDDKWDAAPPAVNWDEVKDKAFESRCMEVYAAQLDCMDQNIGRIVAELKAQGQFENTLIFYLQDNGACAELIGRGTNFTARAEKPSLSPMAEDAQQFDSQPRQTRDGWPMRAGLGVMPGGPDTYLSYGRGWANVSNTPFREYKHWTHEGGLSTPLIVHWPAGVAAARRGALEMQPGQLVDLMATCLDVAGASYPAEQRGEKIKPFEGTSLRPVFSGNRIERTKPLVWEHEGNRAIRDGNWKLVAKENKPWELYNLAADRTELHDLSSSEPDRVKTMAASWDAWAARADVLPLGAWRGRSNAANSALSQEGRFELKAGDHLARAEAPPIAGRAFTITAKFNPGAARDGVLIAQGGTAHGYVLFLADGALHFTVRSRAGVATATTPGVGSGTRTAVARLDARGALTLKLNDRPSAAATRLVPIILMPVDGLDVGSDQGGAVGPYSSPNEFAGTIEVMTIELDKP